jgi:hypothetical protein
VPTALVEVDALNPQWATKPVWWVVPPEEVKYAGFSAWPRPAPTGNPNPWSTNVAGDPNAFPRQTAAVVPGNTGNFPTAGDSAAGTTPAAEPAAAADSAAATDSAATTGASE